MPRCLSLSFISKYGKKSDGGTLVNVSYGGIGILNAGETIGEGEIRKQISVGIKRKVIDSLGGEDIVKKKISAHIDELYNALTNPK